jgi:hypothetical protein
LAILLANNATGSLKIFLVVLLLAPDYPVRDVDAEEAHGHREEQFKAAYLLNFLQFIEWPAHTVSDSLTVCFVGGQAIYAAFASGLDAKRAGTRRILARQLESTGVPTGCNAIYLDSAASQRVASIVPPQLPILTISDANSFAAHGGMIELFMETNKLRFNINLENAQKSGLRISSSLLQLAAAVDAAMPQ